MSQQDLATALGTTPQYISLIEQDKAHPSSLLVPKIAQELGLTCDYILSGKKGPITDSISAIKANNTLSLKSKNLLIAGIQQLRRIPNHPGMANDICPPDS